MSTGLIYAERSISAGRRVGADEWKQHEPGSPADMAMWAGADAYADDVSASFLQDLRRLCDAVNERCIAELSAGGLAIRGRAIGMRIQGTDGNVRRRRAIHAIIGMADGIPMSDADRLGEEFAAEIRRLSPGATELAYVGDAPVFLYGTWGKGTVVRAAELTSGGYTLEARLGAQFAPLDGDPDETVAP